MQAPVLAGIVITAVLADFVLVWFVLRLVMRRSIGRLAREYPPVSPAADAVRKNFQSFRFGLVNAGLSVHAAVDDRYLHLFPAAILRAMGARPASIPWEAIRLVRAGRLLASVRVGPLDVQGPRWCLALAGEGS
jgi:hypothetical protein